MRESIERPLHCLRVAHLHGRHYSADSLGWEHRYFSGVRKNVSVSQIQRQVGDRIAVARKAAGMTQAEAARESGIALRRWQRIEQGAVNPTVRTLAVVAMAIDSDFWELLSRR